MDFTSTISFPNEPLISWTFLDHFFYHFWVGLLLLCCCTHLKMMKKMAKKYSTDQSFIPKKILLTTSILKYFRLSYLGDFRHEQWCQICSLFCAFLDTIFLMLCSKFQIPSSKYTFLNIHSSVWPVWAVKKKLHLIFSEHFSNRTKKLYKMKLNFFFEFK